MDRGTFQKGTAQPSNGEGTVMKTKEVDHILLTATDNLIQMQERCIRCLKSKDKDRVKFWFGSYGNGLILDDEMAGLRFSVKQLEKLCERMAKQ